MEDVDQTSVGDFTFYRRREEEALVLGLSRSFSEISPANLYSNTTP
jgi:hypothetical protein